MVSPQRNFFLNLIPSRAVARAFHKPALYASMQQYAAANGASEVPGAALPPVRPPANVAALPTVQAPPPQAEPPPQEEPPPQVEPPPQDKPTPQEELPQTEEEPQAEEEALLPAVEEPADDNDVDVIKAKTMYKMVDTVSGSNGLRRVCFLSSPQAAIVARSKEATARMLESFGVDNPRLVVRLQSGTFGEVDPANEKKNEKAIAKLTEFMCDVLLPLCAKYNAVIIGAPTGNVLFQTLLRATALMGARWGASGQLPFTILCVERYRYDWRIFTDEVRRLKCPNNVYASRGHLRTGLVLPCAIHWSHD